MSKYGAGEVTILLVDGYNLLPSLTEPINTGKENITQQTNAFGASGEEHTPVGIAKGILTVGGGFYDPTTDALHSALGAVTGIQRIICVGVEGNIIGKRFIGYEGPYSQKYEVMDFRDGLTKANATYIVSGDVDEGVIVQDHVAVTADKVPPTGDTPIDYTLDVNNRSIGITSNSIANPSVVTTDKAHGLTTGDIVFIAGVTLSTPTINGQRTVTVISPTTFSVAVNVTVGGVGGTFVKANSNAGGIGYLQVSAYSGFTGVLHKIVHSPDDTVYATLVTFANITAIGKERVEVSGTVDRYLSSNIDVTGAGSITPFMGFARN